MVLLSSFLGRSPQDLSIAASPTRLAVLAWLLGTFFIGNYLQSSITASRSIPVFSAEIKTKEQVLKRLHEGSQHRRLLLAVARIWNLDAFLDF
ncbi:hypothetical protein MTO96_035305 [Rhipicephalus appendiculatus]